MKKILPKGKLDFPKDSPRLKAYGFMMIATVIWGLAGPIIKFTLGGIPALPFLVYRFYISTLIALVSFAIFGFKFPKDPKTRVMVVAYGLLQAPISLGLLFLALEHTTALNMSLITLSIPLVITTAGAFYLKEHVTKREKVGIGIALLGTIFVVIGPLLFKSTGGGQLLGNVLLFSYVLFNTVPAILAKHLLREKVEATLFANMAFIIGFITLLPILLLKTNIVDFGRSILHLPWQYQLGVLFMAALSGNLAFTLSTKAQKTIEVGEASIFTYLYPLFATPLAVVWLGEKITSRFIFGGIIILIGVIIAEYKDKKIQSNKNKEST